MRQRGIDTPGPSAAFIPADTTHEAYDVQNEVYRRMSGRERTEIMFRLNALARETTLGGIRRRHPDYDAAQVQMAYRRIVLRDDDLVQKVWPGCPLVEP